RRLAIVVDLVGQDAADFAGRGRLRAGDGFGDALVVRGRDLGHHQPPDEPPPPNEPPPPENPPPPKPPPKPPPRRPPPLIPARMIHGSAPPSTPRRRRPNSPLSIMKMKKTTNSAA